MTPEERAAQYAMLIAYLLMSGSGASVIVVVTYVLMQWTRTYHTHHTKLRRHRQSPHDRRRWRVRRDTDGRED